MKHICVFCSARDLAPKYTGPAKEFAALLAQNGFSLVWGGSNRGLMKIVADEVRAGGGKLVGISMELLKASAKLDADEVIIAKDLGTRKAAMLARCEALVVLVGGIGTLDEITEVLALRKLKIHNKPIVVLNTENFYEGFKVQLQKMKDDGFINVALADLIYFADTPNEAIEYLKKQLK